MAANPSIQLGTDGNWGIKEDNLLAYKKDGNRFFNKEFDFSRGSSATYVAKDGLIKTAGIQPNSVLNGDFSQEGAELVTNGGFDTDSNWNLNNASISNGVANFTPANSYIWQNTNISQSTNVVLTYEIKSSNNQQLKLAGGGNSFPITSLNTSIGTHTYYLQTVNNNSGRIIITSYGFKGSIDNISLKEVGQNWDITQGTIGDNRASFSTTDGSFAAIQQNNVLTVGKRYKYSFEILSITGSVYFLNNNINYTTTGVKNGEFTSSYNFLQIKATVGINNTSAEITNISVQEIQVDTPRIDFSDSPKGALLLENSSTNLVEYSEDFSNSYWQKRNIQLQSGFSSPDGLNNAYKVTKTDTDSILYVNYNPTYRLTDSRSIWARTTSGEGQVHLCAFNGNTNRLFTVTENWQRFDLSGYTAAGASSFYGVDFRGSSTLSEVILWGAQAEDNSFATSYIPTYGNTATRLAETCINSGSEQDFNSEEGVLYAEIAAIADSPSNQLTRLIVLSDSNVSNPNSMVNIGFKSSNRLTYEVKPGFAYIHTDTDLTAYSKMALKYKENDFSCWLNGVKVFQDFSGNAPSNLSVLDLSSFRIFDGKIKELKVFNKALTDTELQQLTTQ